MSEGKFQTWIFVVGVLVLINSVRILYDGRIRHILLGDERYIVGTIALIFSIYIIYLSFKNKMR